MDAYLVVSEVDVHCGCGGLLAALAGQLLSYRRSPWERRQQLKWLMSGSAIAGVSIVIAVLLSGSRSEVVRVLGDIAIAGTLADRQVGAGLLGAGSDPAAFGGARILTGADEPGRMSYRITF